ncbi:hypothetical protein [Fodinicola feengrottensis]|uniref:hypothetical protein n=1 Tax=Fodinicola feengrottensis TaxID=435914 RepID=UPI0013D07CCD|nr:hypothetical protein [Fodinicola feengrottensis]
MAGLWFLVMGIIPTGFIIQQVPGYFGHSGADGTLTISSCRSVSVGKSGSVQQCRGTFTGAGGVSVTDVPLADPDRERYYQSGDAVSVHYIVDYGVPTGYQDFRTATVHFVSGSVLFLLLIPIGFVIFLLGLFRP